MKKIILSIFAATALFGADNQADLKLINADVAHNQGITGQGINVAVIDGPANENHPSLQGQIITQLFSKYYGNTYNPYTNAKDSFLANYHGTHVTGTIVGKRESDLEPYGVAYGAKSINIQTTRRDGDNGIPPSSIYDTMVNNKVVAINNSWNSGIYPLISVVDFSTTYGGYDYTLRDKGYQTIVNDRAFASSPVAVELAKLSSDNKAVIVFASGNEGMSSPGLYGVLPSYDESLKTWLVVGAVDSSKISKNADGSLSMTSLAVSTFGNGFKGATNYALMAPGNNINSTRSDYDLTSGADKFSALSGTSQAAPHVTGAAALVAQKFSFLTPKQVADILLSTANNNFTAPKVILKKSSGTGNKTIYTVFYIDNEPPKDKETIRQDLIQAGYSASDASSAVAQGHNSSYFDEDYYTWVQRVSKADIFGQGILDIQKALNGVAVLDANRLTDSDVKRVDKTITIGNKTVSLESKNTVYYTLEVNRDNDENAEFKNNISQKVWDDSLHQTNPTSSYYEQKVINKATKLKGLNVGLRKIGNGTLTLSGQNSYEGPTLVENGELVLNGSILSSNGNVYIERNGIFTFNKTMLESDTSKIKTDVYIGGNVLSEGVFRGSGTIKGSFINRGILKAGFYDENTQKNLTSNYTLDILNTFYQDLASARLELAFTKEQAKTINSQFKAKSYDVRDGSLVYIPLQETDSLISASDVVTLNLDTGLVGQLDKFNISALSTNLLVFDMNEDGKSFTARNKGTGETQGKTLAKGQAKPSLNPDTGGDTGGTGGSGSGDQGGSGSGGGTGGGDSGGSGGSGSGSGTGGSGSGTGSGSGDQGGAGGSGSGSGSGGESGGQGGQGQNPQNPGQGQNPNPQPNPNPLPNMPANPNPNAGTVIGALQGMLGKENINKASKELLASLDNMSQGDFKRATKSLSDSPTSTTNRAIETLENSLNIKNTLFLIDSFDSLGSLNTNSVVFAPTAAFGDEYLGKVDDIYIKTQLSGGIAYRQTKHDDYDQKAYLADIQAKKAISDSTELGGFFGLGHAKTDKDDSKIKSNMFSLGLSVKHDLGAFGVLGSLSGGLSFNRYEHSIFGINDKSTAKYKNYFFSAQAGVYKNIALSENFVISPLALLNYSFIRQDSFSENRAGLSRYFSAQNTNHTRAFVGANFAYQNMLANHEITTSFYVFYWQKFGARNTNENISFAEAKELKFTNTSKADKNGFYGGVSLQVKRNNKFVRISISDEKAKNYNQFEAMLRMGINF